MGNELEKKRSTFFFRGGTKGSLSLETLSLHQQSLNLKTIV